MPLPADNSKGVVNVIVKHIDKDWTSEDLMEIFDIYGEIKSAKVSINHKTQKSNGYGYVWFFNESSAIKAIKESQNCVVPFLVEPYKPKD